MLCEPEVHAMVHGLTGLDHAAVLVRDLDKPGDAWASLGFTLSPRGCIAPLRDRERVLQPAAFPCSRTNIPCSDE
jgi:hypothetical protein